MARDKGRLRLIKERNHPKQKELAQLARELLHLSDYPAYDVTESRSRSSSTTSFSTAREYQPSEESSPVAAGLCPHEVTVPAKEAEEIDRQIRDRPECCDRCWPLLLVIAADMHSQALANRADALVKHERMFDAIEMAHEQAKDRAREIQDELGQGREAKRLDRQERHINFDKAAEKCEIDAPYKPFRRFYDGVRARAASAAMRIEEKPEGIAEHMAGAGQATAGQSGTRRVTFSTNVTDQEPKLLQD